jgi:inhibitor of cysteine peptidase
MTMPVFTATACGGVIKASVNVPLAIDLEENPTTGYRWDFEADPGLEIVSSSYSLNEGGGVGGGGARRFVMRADGPGTFAVRGKLWRSWTGDSSILKRCEITVQAS